jgi:1-deoxy-D-xylulose-5-phosphate reductoisomerase
MGGMKKIAVLGSTGSIGRQALDVIRAFPDELKVVALTANKNSDLLERQIKEFQPGMFCSSTKPGVDYGGEFLPAEEIAGHPEVDFVIVATVGKSGLSPTLAALRAGKTVALASKEVLVMAGEIIAHEASLHKLKSCLLIASIVPSGSVCRGKKIDRRGFFSLPLAGLFTVIHSHN